MVKVGKRAAPLLWPRGVPLLLTRGSYKVAGPSSAFASALAPWPLPAALAAEYAASACERASGDET